MKKIEKQSIAKPTLKFFGIIEQLYDLSLYVYFFFFSKQIIITKNTLSYPIEKSFSSYFIIC